MPWFVSRIITSICHFTSEYSNPILFTLGNWNSLTKSSSVITHHTNILIMSSDFGNTHWKTSRLWFLWPSFKTLLYLLNHYYPQFQLSTLKPNQSFHTKILLKYYENWIFLRTLIIRRDALEDKNRNWRKFVIITSIFFISISAFLIWWFSHAWIFTSSRLNLQYSKLIFSESVQNIIEYCDLSSFLRNTSKKHANKYVNIKFKAFNQGPDERSFRRLARGCLSWTPCKIYTHTHIY